MLEGKAALVTGAASGIGYDIATQFAKLGASVLLVDRSADGVARAAADIGGSAKYYVGDVAESADVQNAVATAVAEFGKLDIAVHNAGIEYLAPFVEHDEDEFDRLVSVNLRGVFLGTKYAARAMSESGGGAVINISSMAGLRGMALHAGYAASKAGAISLTQTAACEFRALGIRVNAVCPGIIETPILESAADFFAASGISVEQMATQIQGRLGAPADISALVTFLASDAASLISGVAIPVDGAASAKVF